MKCVHCQVEFHPEFEEIPIGSEGQNYTSYYVWFIHKLTCPACLLPIIYLEYREERGGHLFRGETFLAYPRVSARGIAPSEVPDDVSTEFNEASLILADSPQASAALSRRCLQHVLKERGVSKKDNLGMAIDDALNSGIPSYIADNLDAIRNIGNFAAHPQKSEQSGEILPVEEHEADWNLDVLEMLFDFYYVQPAKASARRDALNKKLEEAGKSPMKSS